MTFRRGGLSLFLIPQHSAVAYHCQVSLDSGLLFQLIVAFLARGDLSVLEAATLGRSLSVSALAHLTSLVFARPLVFNGICSLDFTRICSCRFLFALLLVILL